MSRSSVSVGARRASFRRTRSRLYQLLAAAHSGPLGQELTGIIRATASSLFEGECLPEVLVASPADLYRQVYGLGTKYPRVTHPLPAKLMRLSRGAAAQRRAYEAVYIEGELLPCLDRVLARAEALDASGYLGLLSLTRAIMRADVKRIHNQPTASTHVGAPGDTRLAGGPEMKYTSVTEANLQALVYDFYARVRAHETLGPIFNPTLAGRWEVHLPRMVDFWSSVLLASGRYAGSPLHAHLLVQGLEPRHFRDWLELFRETLDNLYTPAVAERIFTAASRMGERMQYVLFERSQVEGTRHEGEGV